MQMLRGGGRCGVFKDEGGERCARRRTRVESTEEPDPERCEGWQTTEGLFVHFKDFGFH